MDDAYPRKYYLCHFNDTWLLATFNTVSAFRDFHLKKKRDLDNQGSSSESLFLYALLTKLSFSFLLFFLCFHPLWYLPSFLPSPDAHLLSSPSSIHRSCSATPVPRLLCWELSGSGMLRCLFLNLLTKSNVSVIHIWKKTLQFILYNVLLAFKYNLNHFSTTTTFHFLKLRAY